MPRRAVPAGIRITKVGLWYILVTLTVGVAGANSGNNSLYLVESVLLAILVISGVASRANVRGLELELKAPQEIYAGRRFALRVRVRNRGRLLVRRLLVVRSSAKGPPVFIAALRPGEEQAVRLDLFPARRGLFPIRYLQVSSISPLGLFRKGLRYPVELEVVVFPEVFPVDQPLVRPAGTQSDVSIRRAGWGHELLSLRPFRPGDDQRAIHWKRSARTGELIFMEREAEKGRRLSILLDNGAGPLAGASALMAFERLVSEAASAAHHYLERGFEVELVSRSGSVPPATGRAHRLAILGQLALIDSLPPSGEPLRPSDPRTTALKLDMGAARAAR